MYKGMMISLRSHEQKCKVTIVGDIKVGETAMTIDNRHHMVYYTGGAPTRSAPAEIINRSAVMVALACTSSPDIMAGMLYLGNDTSNVNIVHLAGQEGTKVTMVNTAFCRCAEMGRIHPQ